MFSLENTQKWSKIERPHDLLCWCWWNPGLFGQFLAHFGQKTIQVCISLPILYRALGDPCDPLQLTTLANKLCNYLINPIVYHSHLYGNLQSGPSKISHFGSTCISFFGFFCSILPLLKVFTLVWISKKRWQITILSTIHLKRRCSGYWFSTFAWRFEPK